MSTLCRERFFVGLFADNAGKRDTLQNRVVVVILIFVTLANLISTTSASYNGASEGLSSLGDNLPLSIQLPALFHVESIVKKHARLSVHTALFVDSHYKRRV